MADCLETFSLNDSIQSATTFSYSHKQQLYEIESLCALTCAMAVTETNMHGTESQARQNFSFAQMQKPVYYESQSQLRTNKLLLSEVSKQQSFSDDMVIASLKSNQMHMLPFVCLIKRSPDAKLFNLCAFRTVDQRLHNAGRLGEDETNF